jgi:hypothetical protein
MSRPKAQARYREDDFSGLGPTGWAAVGTFLNAVPVELFGTNPSGDWVWSSLKALPDSSPEMLLFLLDLFYDTL